MTLDQLIASTGVAAILLVPIVSWMSNRHRKQIDEAVRKAREEGVEAGLGDSQRAATKRQFERIEELEAKIKDLLALIKLLEEWKRDTELLLVDAGIMLAPGSQVGREGRGIVPWRPKE